MCLCQIIRSVYPQQNVIILVITNQVEPIVLEGRQLCACEIKQGQESEYSTTCRVLSFYDSIVIVKVIHPDHRQKVF